MAELTYENLKKHLARFGADGVMDTARDAGFTLAELVKLQEIIDKLPTKGFPVRHRKSAEGRVRTWLGLDDQEATE